MTIHLPENLESSILAAVHSGHFASLDDAMAEAARLLLQKLEQGQGAGTKSALNEGNPDPLLGSMRDYADERDEIVADAMQNREQHSTGQDGQALQQRLLQAGLIHETKPPITDMAPYRNRQAVPIQGEPLSETVIRERR